MSVGEAHTHPCVGDAVRITRHELTPYIGRQGHIYSLTTTSHGPSAYVRFPSGGGVFCLVVDLAVLTP